MSERAHSIFEVKSLDDEQRVIEGIASTPTPDRVQDVMEPLGGEFKLPLPFMWQHGKGQPQITTAVGHVIAAAPSEEGIRVRVQVERDDVPGLLKDQLDYIWRCLVKRLVRGFSIGFRPLKADPIKGTFGIHYKRWEWTELSAVTIPANAEASIQLIKSLDEQFRSAPGALPQVHPLGASSTVVRLARKGAPTTMNTNLSERKLTATAEKTAKVAALNALMNESDGSTLDAERQEKFDTITAEIKALDGDLSRIDTLERINRENATPVHGQTAADAAISRNGSAAPVIRFRETLEKGIGYARAVKVKTVARVEGRNVLEVSKSMYPSDDRLQAYLTHQANLPGMLNQIKAAMAGATTLDPTWAGVLSDPTGLEAEFVEFMRPQTIIGQLNLTPRPFNTRVLEQTVAGDGYWVGEGAPKPVTAFGWTPRVLGPTKVAAIAVASEESLRFSSPSLDTLVRDALSKALIARIDKDLLDPAIAAIANVRPASLTNGVTPLTSNGNDAAGILNDLAAILAAFSTNNITSRIALVMPAAMAVMVGLMRNALGQPEFGGMSRDGGSMGGIRVVTSNYVANMGAAGNLVVAIAEEQVLLADDGSVRIDMSDQASIQMDSAPTGATAFVSMWQTDNVAFRAERFINWDKLNPNAVVYMDNVAWGSPVVTP